MFSFLRELKRRQIYKAVAAYIVVAWLFTQIGAATFPVMRLPEWTLNALIVLLALAFPIAMFMAWTANEDRAQDTAITDVSK